MGAARLLVDHGADFDAALQIASLAGHDDIVSYLLSEGADPNDQRQSFGTALQTATAAGQEKVVQLLLSEGADANGKGRHFGTALEVASAVGNKSLVRLLLDKGADPGLVGGNFGIRTAQLLHGTIYESDLKESSKSSPLGFAAGAGHEEIVQMLLEQLPRFMETYSEWFIGRLFTDALEKVACNGHLRVFRVLLDNRSNYGTFSFDDLPLESASRYGHEDIVRFTLEKCARPSQIKQALQAATKGNYESIVRLLLEHGADVNCDGYLGAPLHIASYGGFENLVRIFIEKGADVDRRGRSRSTPLLLASAAGHDSVVRLLLQHGADPRAVLKSYSVEYHSVTKFGTALQAAVYGGHEKVTRLLLEHPTFSEIKEGKESKGIQDTISDSKSDHDSNIDHDVSYSPTKIPISHGSSSYSKASSSDESAGEDGCLPINTNKGKFGTALQAACFNGDERTTHILLNNGADPNIQGGQFGTPLQAACFGGFENIVRLLLDNGANVSIEKGLYGTALQAAAFRGQENLVRLLIQAGADVKSQGGKPEKARDPYGARGDSSDDDGECDSEFGSEDDLRERIPEYGVDAASQGRRQCGKYGTALQAAAAVGNAEIGMYFSWHFPSDIEPLRRSLAFYRICPGEAQDTPMQSARIYSSTHFKQMLTHRCLQCAYCWKTEQISEIETSMGKRHYIVPHIMDTMPLSNYFCRGVPKLMIKTNKAEQLSAG
jgi:ankyrin repeat protein